MRNGLCDSHLARTGGKKAQKEKNTGQQNYPNMGLDLHHMATFILCVKMWHCCQNSLSVLTWNPPKKVILHSFKVKFKICKCFAFFRVRTPDRDNEITKVTALANITAFQERCSLSLLLHGNRDWVILLICLKCFCQKHCDTSRTKCCYKMLSTLPKKIPSYSFKRNLDWNL